MAVTLVIGSQWGDEGKGKIIDYLSSNTDILVRFHGGNNAGHTVKNEKGVFALHLIPSGIFHTGTKACITNGTVINLEVLLSEITMLEKAGIVLKNRLFISPRCHVILPYHTLLDSLYEDNRGKNKTGTTKRGIGPVYADKVSYSGIRLFDLLTRSTFSEKLSSQLQVKNKVLTRLGSHRVSQKKILSDLLPIVKKIKPYIHEPYPLLRSAQKNNLKILCEGAQGTFLDTDWGTYPFVTASTVLSGAVTAGAGIPPAHITRIIGVAKAYTTRVGNGPFPTELNNAVGDSLRREGNEFGTTTARPRRCGWFDAVLSRFASEINGFTHLAITKLDVLDSFKTIKMCTGYHFQGKQVEYFDLDTPFLDEVKPHYKSFTGWQCSTKGMTKYSTLPDKAKYFLEAIEKEVGIPIALISTGQETNAVIKK